MIRRLGSISSLLSLSILMHVEAASIGVFFVQSLRYLIGSLYSRIASALLHPALNPDLIDPALPGLVDPTTVNNELTLLFYVILLPLITIIVGRLRWVIVLAAAMTVAGRYLMIGDDSISPIIGSIATLGGSLLYISMMVQHRARTLPTLFIMGFSIDQLYRAFGDTLDPSWTTDYTSTQLMASIAVLILSFITVFQQVIQQRQGETPAVSPDEGLMTLWGGIGMGALLFLQLSLLALPNAIAGRAQTGYVLIVPLTMAATMLPLVPTIRGRARAFIGLFDSSVRGWVWMLLIMLLVILGVRLEGVIAGVALILSQFLTSMSWWWLTRPRTAKEHNLAGLWIIFGTVLLSILLVFDVFTYEYAFVRDFDTGDLSFLNDTIPPLLRGFRGLGIVILLLSVFIGMLPIVQTRQRIAWTGGRLLHSVVMLIVVAVFTLSATNLAQPPVVQAVINPETVRVSTYNIHAGNNEFFYNDLEAIAQAIEASGADVVLLQEVEAGRLTSYGIDQPLWLARRLSMDRRFYPTNEGLQGLAILSKIPIVFDDGNLLESVGTQTGLQRVQVQPDTGVITLYNTWLDPLIDIDGSQTIEELESSQQAQLDQIFSILSAHHPNGQLGRTVIGGTFNNVPDSALVERIGNQGFVDHFASGTLETTATFWRTGERARLDYLWTARLTVTGRGVVSSNASDHRIATIEVQIR